MVILPIELPVGEAFLPPAGAGVDFVSRPLAVGQSPGLERENAVVLT